MTEERKCPYCPGVKYPGGCPPCAEFIAEHEALEARVKELEAEISWLKHDEQIVAFSDYMNNCCPVRAHQRNGDETIPEDEIRCDLTGCIYGRELATVGFCIADNSDPRSDKCPMHTPICPFCNGMGHFDNTEALETVKGDVGEYVVMLRTILNAALINRNELIEQLNRVKSEFNATIEFLHNATAEVEVLKLELAQAKAAAVNWVTYDGTPETLPGTSEAVLLDAGEDGTIVVWYRLHPVEGRTWCHYEPGTGDFEVAIGDRWAYLPTPGNKEDF